MPSMAELLNFNPPLKEQEHELKHLKLSNDALYFLWHGLAPDTRTGYNSAKKSYEYYCGQFRLQAWPAQEKTLVEWITGRGTGRSKLKYQGKVKPGTIASMLSALQSVHVDRKYSLNLFDSPWLKRVLDGIKRCQPTLTPTKKAKPISLSTLHKLVDSCSSSLSDIHFSTACKVAFAGFLRLGEFTYSKEDLKDKRTFAHTKLTRSDITFDEQGKYAILRLKRSKTDFDHTGVEIVLAATSDDICPVSALKHLVTIDPKPADEPLFRSSNGVFEYDSFVATLQEKLKHIGVPHADRYTGHSFRQGASQHAIDNGILNQDIKRLGRWSSNAFKGYFSTSISHRFSLNLRFLTGNAPPIALYN